MVDADGNVGRVGKGEVVDCIAPSSSREARSMLNPTTVALQGVYKDFSLKSYTMRMNLLHTGVHCQPTHIFAML